MRRKAIEELSLDPLEVGLPANATCGPFDDLGNRIPNVEALDEYTARIKNFETYWDLFFQVG